jgi:hypothetical protein
LGRIVANPDRTAFFGDYFRVAGDTDRIPRIDSQMLDSRVGEDNRLFAINFRAADHPLRTGNPLLRLMFVPRVCLLI